MSQAYDFTYYQIETRSSGKYFVLSVMVHTALVIGSFFVAAPVIENLNKNIVTIELQTPEEPMKFVPPKALEAPKGELVKATRGGEQVIAPAPAAPLNAEAAEKIAGPVQKSKTSKAKAAQIKTHMSGGQTAIAKSAPSRAGVPETLEDIAAPDLEMDGVTAAQVGQLGDNEFEDEFKNVDHSNRAAIDAEKAQLDEEARQIADEKEAALQALADDNTAKAKAMEDALQATRSKNAAVLAQMKATEQAAAEKAAKDAEKRAAALAAASAAAKTRGAGQGAEGADQVSPSNAGIPSGIRSLDQLKQMPGNQKPQYSMEERRDRLQGQVVFYAYISKLGSPTQFRLAQSTGFRNLDGKTLKALKAWKFYPGQEGWVEIPFRWDIKGGVQEMPTLLRRTGSR